MYIYIYIYTLYAYLSYHTYNCSRQHDHDVLLDPGHPGLLPGRLPPPGHGTYNIT